MAATTPMLLSKNSQAALIQYLRSCYQQHNVMYNMRARMLQIDKQYARETNNLEEQARAKAANRAGNQNRFQDITIPVVMPQVESAVTYQASVFLTGTPLFGVAASPAYENEALAMETAIDAQATRGGWSRHFTMFFRDGFKYNLSAVEVSWGREVTVALETDIGFSASQAKPKEVIWEGNKVKRLDMYNTIYDTRVALAEVHTKGEFAGYVELYSRIALKKMLNELPDARTDNIKEAFESPTMGLSIGGDASPGTFYVPQVNPDVPAQNLQSGTMNWESWAGIAGADQKIAYKDLYHVTTLYARILPSDFAIRVPGANTPQVWKFIFVNNAVLVYAERQTNAHGYIPILFAQPLEDGLNQQTKSLASNVAPIQDITSALSNSSIAARRRSISDRTLYDPSRITEAHINNPNPSAKIPVRSAAYGKNIADAVHQFPFRDDQAQVNAQQMQMYGSMANTISGQNPVRQGQFVKGNKTQSEFQDVMSHSNGRDQLTAMGYETTVFTPLKEICKINILQYQGGVSLYNREKKQQVTLDPVALRKAVLEFKVSDGLTPTDKLMDTDTMLVAMQQIGSSPAIGSAYNLGPLFSYLMKLKGADIGAFEKSGEQQAYEQAMGQYQSMIQQLFKENPDVKQEQLPPAPKPQDYGYDPAKKAGTDMSTPPSKVPAQ
jgi:hypothetical protein